MHAGRGARTAGAVTLRYRARDGLPTARMRRAKVRSQRGLTRHDVRIATCRNSRSSTTPPSRSHALTQLTRYAAEILERLTYSVGKDPIVARPHDWLTATIYAVRDRVIDSWMESTRETWRTSDKRVYYLSLEFLIGRLMRDAMTNIGLMEPGARGAEVPQCRPRRPDRARARRGARQWRPRPARGVLPRVDVDDRRSRPMATASATSTACSARR